MNMEVSWKGWSGYCTTAVIFITAGFLFWKEVRSPA
jgi:hypothetical protein